MNDNDFWATVWVIIALIIITVASIISSHYKHYNETITQALINGVDPIEITCALEDVLGNNPICVILATKKESK